MGFTQIEILTSGQKPKTRQKTKKLVGAVFEKNIKVSDFRLIWKPFREYLQIHIFFIFFFQKSGSVTFLLL